ncbi:hypothetical protein RQP46_009578 [Phenoliferia psychrophenolica]
MPLLVAFDLDFTLWDLWVDTHVTPPLKRKGQELNKIYDKRGQEMGFYPEVPKILMDLHSARQALTELLLPGTLNSHRDNPLKMDAPQTVSSIDLFQTLEIYPGSKLAHFKEIHRKTGIPYREMVFFDDEPRNREVTKLGVHFVLVPEGDGVTQRLFDNGVEAWRKTLASS